MALNYRPTPFKIQDKQGDIASVKRNLLNNYFIERQSQFDQSFVDRIFELAEQDSQIDGLITEHMLRLLSSKQPSVIPFLKKLLTTPKYQGKAIHFLSQLLQLKSSNQNQTLQLYILSNLSQIAPLLNNSSKFIRSIIAYLSLKMRSFSVTMRITALECLKKMGELAAREGGEWSKTLHQVIPQMIERQKLVKQVSYIKGLFLQVLQDQFHEVRQICIQCLGLFKHYFKGDDLKQIIIYMLNDEHELVRQEALLTAKSLPKLSLVRQDLATVLMCLRQKRTNMRRLVYENLAVAQFSDASLLTLLVQKVLIALQNYRSDKKKIYKMLLTVGKNYWQQIGKLMVNLGLGEVEEPNWKSLGYKAKMILCHEWWKRQGKGELGLPSYFIKHMLYICDVEAYLFEQSGMEEQNQQTVDFNYLQRNHHHLITFIQCQEEISQEFHKTVLSIIRQLIIGHTPNQVFISRLDSLSIKFKLAQDERQICHALHALINSGDNLIESAIPLIKRCIQNRQKYEAKDTAVPINKCSISKLESGLIVCSKAEEFVKRIFLRCWVHTLLSKEAKSEFKRVSELQLLRQDGENYFWEISLLRYSRVECVLVINDTIDRVLDCYQVDQK